MSIIYCQTWSKITLLPENGKYSPSNTCACVYTYICIQADDDVIAEVFHAHKSKPPAELRGIPGDTAIRIFDQSVCELIKRHNSLQHVKRNYQQTLASLEMHLAQMTGEAQAINSTPAGDSEAAKIVRQLENRLDKAVIKCNEAKHIRKTYETILQKLQEVYLWRGRGERERGREGGCMCTFNIRTNFIFRKGWNLITR